MIDLLTSEAKCLVHAEPVWSALPEGLRGERVDRNARRPARHPSWNERGALVASGNDARDARRRGYRRIALLEHGIGQSYQGISSAAYPGGVGRDMVDLFLSPNETAAARDRAAYPGARVEVVGCPRLETLARREPGPGPVVAVSFHWSSRAVPELRSALPHFRSALPLLAERFTLLGHCHPMAARDVLPEYRKLGIEVVESFDEVCRRADVYVADNTSTLYEFAATGRPVVVLDAPWYRRDVEHGLRFWAAAGVGVNVRDPGQLPEAIDSCFWADAPDVPEREAALDIVYACRTGAAVRAAEAISAWLA